VPGLGSDLATIVDDVEAYQAVLGAIRSIDPGRAAAFRRPRWTPGLRLCDPLGRTSIEIVEAIEKA
jgi:alpha-L-rhamnosidase